MSQYKHLDDIERREHRDLLFQWLPVALALVMAVALVIVLFYVISTW